MKFAVTYVPVGSKTRRRTGKSKVQIVDTEQPPWNQLNIGSDPKRMEEVFETVDDRAKVIDIREVNS